MSKVFFGIIFTFLACHDIQCQYKLIMNNDIEQAYKDISELKMASGLQKIDHIKKTDPNNAMVYYIENYVDFFTLFIQEDEALYK